MALEHNIIFHHCLILSYIINLYAKLNNQLEREEVSHKLSDIYLKLSLLLQNVNKTIGPLVFGVLLSELMAIAFYIRTLYLLINKMQIYIERGLEINTLILCVSFNIFLYFWMCDRFNSTIYQTGEIIKEYITKNQNLEVCMLYFLLVKLQYTYILYLQVDAICQTNLILSTNINIFGLFSIDLSSIFVLVSEITLLAIIFIQNDIALSLA